MRVEVHELTHAFPGRPALYGGLTTRFEAGDLVAVTGPSGSGKTTLLSILAGWLPPTSGTIDHIDIGRISWVAQSPHGVTQRTALDHVVLALLARGFTRPAAEQEAHALLATFGLSGTAHRAFRYLSGGEGQRLTLATSIAAQPDLLLVDEPTAGLDPISAATVIDTLGALADASRIVLVSTHDPRVRDACHTVLDVASPAPVSEASR